MSSHLRELTVEAWRDTLANWCANWGLPGFEREITIAANSRLRVTLGQYKYQEQRIEIAEFLLEEPNEVVLEVLCHEAAHAAAAQLHEKRIAHHGPEWRDLMQRAGYSPNKQFLSHKRQIRKTNKKARRALWEHRCEVCHMRRVAKRPVKEWRCALCRKAGLKGDLVITKLEESGSD